MADRVLRSRKSDKQDQNSLVKKCRKISVKSDCIEDPSNKRRAFSQGESTRNHEVKKTHVEPTKKKHTVVEVCKPNVVQNKTCRFAVAYKRRKPAVKQFEVLIPKPLSERKVLELTQQKGAFFTTHTDTEYTTDALSYQMSREQLLSVPSTFLINSKEVTAHMRSILADWLLQVQNHLILQQETLHLAMQLVDQYVYKCDMPLAQYQLLGVACLLIASKFEERFPPAINNLISLTDDAYSLQQVLCLERKVLNKLHFNISHPTPIFFLDKFVTLSPLTDTKVNEKLKYLTRYMIDLIMVDIQVKHYHPSLQAAAVLCLARKIIAETCVDSPDNPAEWIRVLSCGTTYQEIQLRPCMMRIAKALTRARKSKFQGALTKYSSHSHFRGISKWVHLNTSRIVLHLAKEDVETKC